MLWLKELLKKLKDPFSILAVVAFLLSVVSLFDLGAWRTLLLVCLGATLMGLLSVIARRSISWIESRPGVMFCRNWDEVPDKYKVGKTLDFLATDAGRLEMVGRTCFRWLCGDEIEFEKDKESFQKTQSDLQDRIRKAIEHGSSIHFVLQNPNIPVPRFGKSENERLRHQAEAGIASYEFVRSTLKNSDKERLTLALTNMVVENSMLRLKEDAKITRLVIDLSIQFQAPKAAKAGVSKPVLIFRSGGPQNEEYMQEFDYILHNSIQKEDFDGEKGKGLKEVTSLIKQYSHHSILRKDESKALASIASRYFLTENDTRINALPPVSIQLLVTNQCTTHCKMCDHYKLFKPEAELTQDELFCTLECIKHIGTKAIIISGGEPLARDDIFDILRRGKNIGLSMGLLTNGVMKRGKSLDSGQAEAISETCSWVQLSIDSFIRETYNQIRGNDCLESALESLRNLVKAGLNDIEVCFTIQKDNFKEIDGISDRINQLLPPNVPVRFKFAHGPSAERDFLCSVSELENAIMNLPRGSDRFNSDYLLSMIEGGYFDYPGLSEGVPLKNKMGDYKGLGFTCHALRLTCKIDANGDIYPCCFLFDDNYASSKFRSSYRIGSLRSSQTKRVMPPDRWENALATTWYQNDKLKHYRRDMLPVDAEACNYCTRHFYQNEYLNRLHGVFKQYPHYGIFEELAKKGEDDLMSTFWV